VTAVAVCASSEAVQADKLKIGPEILASATDKDRETVCVEELEPREMYGSEAISKSAVLVQACLYEAERVDTHFTRFECQMRLPARPTGLSTSANGLSPESPKLKN
jgi:hypothetical protein